MSYLRAPFIAGFFLHSVLLFSRIRISDLSCMGRDCGSIVWADLPLSVIYLAFPDGVLILVSLFVGGILWGLWGLAIHRGLRFFFRE